MARINYEFMLSMRKVRRLLLLYPLGLKDSEIAALTGLPVGTVWRCRRTMPNVVEVEPHRYTATPTPGEIELALAVLERRRIEAL